VGTAREDAIEKTTVNAHSAPEANEICMSSPFFSRSHLHPRITKRARVWHVVPR
jgi:hypothetical protein